MSSQRLPDGFLDELKARVRLSAVVGRKVKLQPAGPSKWKGLSPFSNEKTPSFYVDDAKRFYKCFSTGNGGDVIKFLQETERLGFMEAVERLAGEAGMALPAASPEEKAAYDRRARLKEACTAAAAFFQERLRSSEGEAARLYLERKRGLGGDAWDRHGVGYAPDDWRRLWTHLTGQGFSPDEIMGAGLARTSEKAKEPYDVFRGRIMFPILGRRGEVIAFGGRALSAEAGAKYMNSPDTDLFHKSRVLYNYERARAALGYGGRGGLVVCEGYMDVIALHEAGVETAVAPLGTALTEEQLAMVWAAGPDPVLCFDGDKAGLAAAYKGVSLALPHLLPDKSAYFALLPEGLDPDDLIRERGADAMKAELARALPLSEMLWRRERDAEPLDTPERQAGLEARLEASAGLIQHPGVKAAYQRDLRQRLRDHLWAMRRAARTGGGRTDGGARTPVWRPPARKPGRTTGIMLLIRAADHPFLIDQFDELLVAAEFPDDGTRSVRDALIDLHSSQKPIDRGRLKDHLVASGKSRALTLLEENYLATPQVDPSGDAVQEWRCALELFAARRTTDDDVRERPEVVLSSKEKLDRVKKSVANRRAMKTRLRDLQQD